MRLQVGMQLHNESGQVVHTSGRIKKKVVGGRHPGAEGRPIVKYRDLQLQ